AASISIAWDASGNAAGTLYTVLTSTDSGFGSGAVVTAVDTYNTFLSSAGLSANTTYHFAVAATNSNGTTTDYSGAASTSTLLNPPGPPSFTAVAADSISIAWDPSGNAAGTLYHVLASTDAGFGFGSGAVVTAADTYNTFLSSAGLSANTTYHFAVAA